MLITLAINSDPRLVDGILIMRGDQIGTLMAGLFGEVRLSEDGRFWCANRTDMTIVSGPIPDVMPPLVLFVPDPIEPPEPPEPPIPPIPPPQPPEPLMRMFKSDAERKKYCNDLAPIVAVRLNQQLGDVAPDTGLIDPQGQAIWSSFDQWYAVQPAWSVPPADVMLDLTIDRLRGTIADDQLQKVLKNQEPLR